MNTLSQMTSTTRQTTWNIKYELAERISNSKESSKQILQFMFDEIIMYLETLHQTEFPPLMRKGVWKSFSKQNLKVLQDHFHHEFYGRVLVGFTEAQMVEILEFQANASSLQLQSIFILKQSSITDTVIKQASLKKSLWKEEIREAFRSWQLLPPIPMDIS